MPNDNYPLIGLFGGTFDPVHYGHLRAALEVCQSLKLKELRFIPAGQPVHRPAPIASAAHRIAMLELAIAEILQFTIDKREINSAEPSYTVNTLLSLRQELPHAALCLLVGVDAFAAITTWHRWQDILMLAHLIVLQRPGFTLPSSDAVGGLLAHQISDKKELAKATHGAIWVETITPLAISSTLIRNQLAIGNIPYFLLPQSVINYSKEHQIYKESQLLCT